jgi:transcriptional regulator with PAS, ATPase and Fis domain
MQAFMSVVQRVAKSNTSLLILGETGVGKERLARAIHAESLRSEGPFTAVNCGALPDSLLESELFGHEEGAFTGAVRSRRGWFELSHGGTVFLDEIGEMPLHLQVKLLRVLQEKEIQRIGSEKTVPIDVRIMAATNRNLEEEVGKKRFRRDLYYRLGVVTLTLPPLRERKEDITSLVEGFIDYFSSTIGRDLDGIEEDALGALHKYPWPGNVRELANVIERAVLLSNDLRISLRDFPATISGAAPHFSGESPRGKGEDSNAERKAMLKKPLKEYREEILEKYETAYLKAMLESTKGRIGRAAKLAGITPRSLFDKMKKYGLKKENFKGE